MLICKALSVSPLLIIIPREIRFRKAFSENKTSVAIRNPRTISIPFVVVVKVYQSMLNESRKSSISFVIFGGEEITLF